MAATPVLYYKAQLALGSGNLMDVTNFRIEFMDNSKKVNTFGGEGIFQGSQDSTLSFDFSVGQYGEEADWVDMVKTLSIKQFRFKVPSRTLTFEGKISNYSLESTLDSEIKGSVTVIGNLII
jgi:hypothetical protein